MAFWDKGNKFPYTNNHDANLDYMMSIFENIKNEWHDLYVDLVEWKGTTTLELNTWKTNALAQIEQYETDFRAEIAVWKANTEQDIGVWEQGVLADLGTWRANFETLFATTFSNLTQIKTDAEAARDAAALSATAAAGSATDAAESATSVSSALTQIQTNTGDISDLKTQIDDINDILIENHIDSELVIVKDEYISTSTGERGYLTPTRARTNILDGYGAVQSLNFESETYNYRVFYYSAAGNLNTGAGYIGSTEFKVGRLVLPNTAIKIAIDFRRVDNANISDSDVDAIRTTLVFENDAITDLNNSLNICENMLSDAQKTYLPLQYGYFSNSNNYFVNNAAYPQNRAYGIYKAKKGDVVTAENNKGIQVTEITNDYTAIGNITTDYVTSFVFPRDMLCIITSKNSLNANYWGTEEELTTSIFVSCKADTNIDADTRAGEYDNFFNIATQNKIFSNLFNPAQTTNYRAVSIEDGTLKSAGATIFATDYVSIVPGEKYTLNFSYYTSDQFGMAFFDENKSFVSGLRQSQYRAGANAQSNFNFVAPNGCYFCRFTIPSDIIPQPKARLTHYIPDLINPTGVPSNKMFIYDGEKISVQNKYSVMLYMKMTHVHQAGSSNQGGACYDKYFFQFEDGIKGIHVYDMESRTFVQDIDTTSVIDPDCHCNNVNFGIEKADNNDIFPLLYAASSTGQLVRVLRITGNVGALTASLVQTITWDAPSESNGSVYRPSIAIDKENKFLIQYGGKTNSLTPEENGVLVLNVFALPTLSVGDIALHDNAKLFTSETPYEYYYQGGIAKCGKLYQTFGNSTVVNLLKVIDIKSGLVLSKIVLDDGDARAWIGEEPEALFEYDGTLFISACKGATESGTWGTNYIVKLNFFS